MMLPPFRSLRLLLALGFAWQLSQPLAAADKPARTVWDGVYASAQAERGQSAYATSCSRCHGEDLTASGNVLRGAKFIDKWREDSLKSLFSGIRNTMPRNAPKSLPDEMYTDIVAYLLQVNAFPAGSEELKVEALENIRLIGKEGPRPVPDFALVVSVGCLIRAGADTWVLQNASEPLRTRSPREATEAEIADAAAKPAGQLKFRLLDTLYFTPEPHAGHWMEAKGFLMRAPGDNRINLTSLRMVRQDCTSPISPKQ